MANKTISYLGLFLMADGILSIAWSIQDGCMNNSPIGQIVRLIRIGIGFYLYTKFK